MSGFFSTARTRLARLRAAGLAHAEGGVAERVAEQARLGRLPRSVDSLEGDEEAAHARGDRSSGGRRRPTRSISIARRMKTIVTGGAGFIGSNLVDALLARGDEVTVLDDLSTGKHDNLERAAGRAELVELDIRDANEVARRVGQAAPDVIFHLAAQIDVRKSVADPGHDSRINVGGTINVLSAALEHGVGRLVNTSTGGAIYGDRGHDPRPRVALAGARGSLRPVEVLRRAVLRALHPPARAQHRVASLRERLRPAPGPPSARPAWWRSSAAS